jgi:hypothetical protein
MLEVYQKNKWVSQYCVAALRFGEMFSLYLSQSQCVGSHHSEGYSTVLFLSNIKELSLKELTSSVRYAGWDIRFILRFVFCKNDG